jgi:hypothetical protein
MSYSLRLSSRANARDLRQISHVGRNRDFSLLLEMTGEVNRFAMKDLDRIESPVRGIEG